jgi:hypothetical protein
MELYPPGKIAPELEVLMSKRAATWLVGVMLTTTAVLSVGCNKSGSSDSSGSGSSGGSGQNSSAAESAAQAAAMAEVEKHWARGSDGWTTARVTGSAYAPDRFIRQMRQIEVQGVQTYELSESDKLNGLEWAGEVTFKSAPCREAGDPGILLDGMSNLGAQVSRRKGRWTQWVDFQPESIHLTKAKGQWQATQDTWLLRGTIPQAVDYDNAGVK